MAARVIVDLDALVWNYRLFTDKAAGHVGAVVKANAYGLGYAAVVEALIDAGCTDFFVATLNEGLSVRSLSEQIRIFVFEGVPVGKVDQFAQASLIPVLNSVAQLERFRGCASPAAVHVDTGMMRLGFDPSLDPSALDGVDVVLLMSHFALADRPDDPGNSQTIERIGELRSRFKGIPASVGNSAAILAGLEMPGDLGRPGIGLYGGNPFSLQVNPMRCVATLEGSVLQVREVPAGTPVGYAASYVTDKPTHLATVGIGYADGLPRSLSNSGSGFVSGQRVPIVGRISMDLTMVDVTGVSVSEGDWVEFFGANITLDELERERGLFSYEMLSRLGNRVERIYIGGDSAT
ncbi:MAG: alanine racemase [Proteobacteria bacterium]|nr:alanine racemase [Pseudomonadota bacterium]